MAQVSMSVSILDELDHLANHSFSQSLNTSEDEFWDCFGFIPSEDYEKVCRNAKNEEIKADAFKDVLVDLFQCMNYFIENVDSTTDSEMFQAKYKDVMNAVHVRLEQLENDLNTIPPMVF